ncbi:MAG: GNAT family N-acetyltransferase [Candidatus Hodarchaeota archaeon]
MSSTDSFLCEAKDDDIDEMVELNRLDAAASFREGKWHLEELEWEEEEPFECFMKGGPWLHSMSLRVQIRLMKEIGSIWLLKDRKNDQIIGETDIVWSPEPQPLGNLLYVAWITIAPEYRGQGLGTRFLSEAVEREIAKHPTVEWLNSIPEDNISKGLYQSVGLETWEELQSFEMPFEAASLQLDHHDFEISERNLQEPPNTLLNCGRLWYPTSYCWAAIRYSGQFREIFRHEQWRPIKAYNLYWNEHLLVITDAKRGYLWMETELAEKPAAYALALKAMKTLAKNNDPKRESVELDVFKRNLKYFLSSSSDVKVKTVPYMRRKVNSL